jgi:hypothetical protein
LNCRPANPRCAAPGRVALAVTRQGSHRPVRAHIRAYGSSTNRFAIYKLPEAIQSISGDMLTNLDVFDMFHLIGSAGRRFASLHRVLRGEFPCFVGTIKALRLPAACPAALRCLRLAVPRLHSLGSLLGGRVRRRGLELFTRWLRPGLCRGSDRISQVPGEPQLSVCTCSVDSGRTAYTRPFKVRQRGPWYVKSKGSHERSFEAQ